MKLVLLSWRTIKAPARWHSKAKSPCIAFQDVLTAVKPKISSSLKVNSFCGLLAGNLFSTIVFNNAAGLPFVEINLDNYPSRRKEMVNRTSQRTVPQIFFNEVHVGGNDDLMQADAAGSEEYIF